jgi:hypothetical protein
MTSFQGGLSGANYGYCSCSWKKEYIYIYIYIYINLKFIQKRNGNKEIIQSKLVLFPCVFRIENLGKGLRWDEGPQKYINTYFYSYFHDFILMKKKNYSFQKKAK